MLNLSAYPNCAARLQKQRCRFEEQGFNAYWAAACVADDFSDDVLTKAGCFDFDDRSEENGCRQLSLLERFIVERRRKAKEQENSPAFKRRHDVDLKVRERVKAMLGSQGIKTSLLTSDDAFWTVAALLWPEHIDRPEAPSLPALVDQIAAIGKKQRPKIARANMHSVPAHLVTESKRAAA